jgi:beta-lactamase superfamily II metal-dependent hydrolase
MASTLRYLDSDVVNVYELDANGKKQRLATLFWGDSVRVVKKTGDQYELDFTTRRWNETTAAYEWVKHAAFISAKVKFRDAALLKIRFVDVGQGDAAMIETPKGELIIVDGGEEMHLRNYVSASWAHVFRTKQVRVAAIVVSHGDADHFAGLPNLVALKRPNGDPAIVVDRVFHNGIVKGPTSAGTQILGKTTKTADGTFITQLEDNLLDVPDSRMNVPFTKWKTALQELKKRNGSMKVRRLEYGDDDKFDFLADEGIAIQVLGPIATTVSGKPALQFLHTPGSSSLSASHTINGHSVVLRLTYGNLRVLFGADLNEESEQTLLARTRDDNASLAAEVLKVPHHGSADFSPRILEAIRPVVSVISSGDENTAKEYIHPRAGLVGALGKFSRGTVERPLIYVTEMVAFFKRLGRVSVHELVDGNPKKEQAKARTVQNAYEKVQFGIVHVRTDGTRVLVATPSGREDMKETYAFTVDENGAIAFEEKVAVL